jgi:hypothetical protein
MTVKRKSGWVGERERNRRTDAWGGYPIKRPSATDERRKARKRIKSSGGHRVIYLATLSNRIIDGRVFSVKRYQTAACEG